MIQQQLLNFFDKAKVRNISDSQTKSMLISAGWSEEDIDQSREAYNLEVPLPSNMPAGNQAEKESHGNITKSFEYTVLFISLIITATSLILILCHYINLWAPERYSYYYNDYSQRMLNSYLSALVTAFPLFCFTFIRTTIGVSKNPQHRLLKSRRVVNFLLLTLSFITILVSSTIYVGNLLNSSVTNNLALRILAILIISGLIFFYYFTELLDDQKKHD